MGIHNKPQKLIKKLKQQKLCIVNQEIISGCIEFISQRERKIYRRSQPEAPSPPRTVVFQNRQKKFENKKLRADWKSAVRV